MNRYKEKEVANTKESNETAQRAELHRKYGQLQIMCVERWMVGILNSIFWEYYFIDLFQKI